MNINIRLDRNFTIQYNALQEKYGESFAKLNGFAYSQLNYTDFINRKSRVREVIEKVSTKPFQHYSAVQL